MRDKSTIWAVFGFGVLVVFMAQKKQRQDGGGVSGSINVPHGAQMTPQQVYELARYVGFPPETARRMVAIAQRESNLIPSSRCINCFPGIVEDSVGLWQINMHGSLGAARLAQFGISSPDELLDPVQNAKAAYLTWGGSEQNLNVAWRIHEEGAFNYRSKYLEFLENLPMLEAMELAYNNGGGGVLA